MNVFDFDKTIYDGDSTFDFYMYILRKHPLLWLRVPGVLVMGLLYALRICSRDRFKGALYASFVPYIDVELETHMFWGSHQRRIKQWYLDMKQPTDLISSASPEFLIKPIGELLRVQVQASRVDSATGRLVAANNRDVEKVRRFKQEYGDKKVDQLFSDSLSDTPLAKLAREAYMVRGNDINPWPESALKSK